MKNQKNFILGMLVFLVLYAMWNILFPQLKKINNDPYRNLVRKLRVFQKYLSSKRRLEPWFNHIIEFDPFFIIPDSSNFTKFKTFVHLCFESDDPSIWYAFCHELAHVANSQYEHNKKFWAKKKKILQQSVDAGIYSKQRHKVCSNGNPIAVNVNILDVPIQSL